MKEIHPEDLAHILATRSHEIIFLRNTGLLGKPETDLFTIDGELYRASYHAIKKAPEKGPVLPGDDEEN